MWLDKAANILGRLITSPGRVGFFIAGGILGLLMLLTTADVTLRYLFNSPIVGGLEMTEYLMGALFALGISYATLTKGHISVDILHDRFSERTQAVLDSVTGIISIGMLSIVTWQTFVQAGIKYSYGAYSPALEIPAFPFFYLLGCGFCFLILTMLFSLMKSVSKVLK